MFGIGAIALLFACALITSLTGDDDAAPTAIPSRGEELAILAATATPEATAPEVVLLPTVTPVPAAPAAQPIAEQVQPTTTPVAEAPTANPLGQPAQVTHIVDGDTIDVLIDGADYTVRYILVDTPERDMPYYSEATNANSALVSNQTVYLQKDVSETDRYGRLLRYVYLADGTFVNLELVRQGYAQIATFPPDVAKETEIRAAQAEAVAAGRGLWAAAAEPVVEQPPVEDRAITVDIGSGTQCDPSYPDVCIPPVAIAGNLNCPDIPQFANFRVLEPDPHGFDREGDGFGCERNPGQ